MVFACSVCLARINFSHAATCARYLVSEDQADEEKLKKEIAEKQSRTGKIVAEQSEKLLSEDKEKSSVLERKKQQSVMAVCDEAFSIRSICVAPQHEATTCVYMIYRSFMNLLGRLYLIQLKRFATRMNFAKEEHTKQASACANLVTTCCRRA